MSNGSFGVVVPLGGDGERFSVDSANRSGKCADKTHVVLTRHRREVDRWNLTQLANESVQRLGEQRRCTGRRGVEPCLRWTHQAGVVFHRFCYSSITID
eukprot:4975287-Prymnesium_polylepis.1